MRFRTVKQRKKWAAGPAQATIRKAASGEKIFNEVDPKTFEFLQEALKKNAASKLPSGALEQRIQQP